MPAVQLIPACKDYAWGGHRRLREDFGIQSDLKPLAEAWVLSCQPDSPSVIKGGTYNGMTLPDYLAKLGPKALGTLGQKFEDFPMLIKLIDAEQSLSVQVHPSDAYAQEHGGRWGKTKMWVVLDAVPGAYLYYGFERETTREEFAARAADGTLTGLLRKVPVKKGEVFFIPAGTVHAAGEGLLIAEFQQNSDAAYRVFDYNRPGADGKPRPLHVEQALEAANLSPVEPMEFGEHLGQCPYFTVDRRKGTIDGMCGKDSFHVLLVVDGGATLYCDGEHKTLNKGGCFFLAAGCGPYRVEGNSELLIAYLS